MTDSSHTSNNALYHNFEIELFRSEQPSSGTPSQDTSCYKVRLLDSVPGGACTQTLLPLPGSAEREDFLQQIRFHRLQSVLNPLKTREIDFVREMGEQLFNLLFCGKMETALKLAWDRASQAHCGLRIRLRLNSPDLQNLPWEYLCDESRDHQFLLIDPKWPLVRYLEQEQSIPQVQIITLPLRILVLIGGDSADTPQVLDWQVELDKLNNILQEAGQPVEIITPGPIGPEALQSWLIAHGQFQIVHFIGHGFFDEMSQEGYLRFSYGEERRDSNGDFLQVLLNGQRDIQLIVLNACFSSRSSDKDSFSSVAAHLTLSNVPAVVAMQFDLLDRTAIQFSRHFYHALVYGSTVEEALAEARKAVYLHYSLAEFGIPVLYSRMREPIQLLMRRSTQIPILPEYLLPGENPAELRALLAEVKTLSSAIEDRLLSAEAIGEEEILRLRQMRAELDEARESIVNTLATPPTMAHEKNASPSELLVPSVKQDDLPKGPSLPTGVGNFTLEEGNYAGFGEPMFYFLDTTQLIREGKRLYEDGSEDNSVERAIRYFEEAVISSPKNSLARYWLGKASNTLGDYDRALRALQEAVQLWPSGTTPTNRRAVYRELAIVYSRVQRSADALYLLNQLLEWDPKDYSAYISRGRLYLGLNKPEEAEADFTNAINLAPKRYLTSAELLWQRAHCYEMMRPSRKEEAFKDYKKFLELTKDEINVNRDKARERINALRRDLLDLDDD